MFPPLYPVGEQGKGGFRGVDSKARSNVDLRLAVLSFMTDYTQRGD